MVGDEWWSGGVRRSLGQTGLRVPENEAPVESDRHELGAAAATSRVHTQLPSHTHADTATTPLYLVLQVAQFRIAHSFSATLIQSSYVS